MVNVRVLLTFTFLFGFFAPILVYADHPDFQISRVEHPTLIKRNISAITQDKSGFMWFGTSNGIIRFDSRSVITIQTGTGADRRDMNNPVNSLYSHVDGSLWASLNSGGLAKIEAHTKNIRYIYPDGVSEKDQIYLDFTKIHPLNDDILLVASYSESLIYEFNVHTEKFREIPISDERGFSDFAVIDIKILSNGEIWIGTDMAGVVVLDANYNRIAHHTSEYQNPDRLSFNSVRSIEEDQNGKVWVATYAGGLNVYDPETKKFSRPKSMYPANSTRFGNTYDLYVDDSNLIWVATDDGLVILHTDNLEHTHHYYFEPRIVRSLINNQVRSIYEDESGTIWVGNENGGVQKITRNVNFVHVNPDPNAPGGLELPIVRSVMQYDDNTLWVGLQGGGISILDLNSMQVLRKITHDPGNSNSLSNDGVTSFLKESNGDVWIGTWGGGLNYYDISTNRFIHYKPIPGDDSSIADELIQFVTKDSKGNYWIGTENGLSLMDRTNGTFTNFKHDPANPNSLSNGSLQSLAFVEDADDVYWIGTWYGLNKFDHKTNTFTHFFSNSLDRTTVSSNHILSIYDDGNGFLWLGTFGGGLNKFNKSTGEVEIFMIVDGLPSNVVFAIQPDEFGNLWLSSNNGVSRFNPESQSIRNFSENEGLNSIEYWWGSSTKMNDGRIIFGSTNGFTLFSPNEVQEDAGDPTVVITSLRVYDRDIAFIDSTELELRYIDNYLTFEFAAFDYINPERIQYAYQLEGVDNAWNYVGNNNIASYSFLKGGDYVFRVRATNSDGVWTTNEASIKIRIHPPFWQQTWFYIILILTSVLAVFGIIQLRTRQMNNRNILLEEQVSLRTKELEANQEELKSRNEELQQQTLWLSAQKEEIENQQTLILGKSQELEVKNKRLVELNQEKNSLVSIVAHDLRSPLAAIMSALELIKLQPDLTDAEIENLLSSIEDFVHKQLEMINRILDMEAVESGEYSFKKQKIDLNGFIKQVVDDMKPVSEKKNIKIRPVPTFKTNFIEADPSYLGQIIENLINNAIKFSPENSNIYLLLEEGKGSVRIGVKDEGPGISQSDQKKLFNKFQKLSAKPTGGESSTGLGLSIVKRFAEAMNGRVWCESNLGEGATFWVEFKSVEK